MKILLASVAAIVVGGLMFGSFAKAQGEAAAEAPFEYVRLNTSMGEIVLELNREKAPISVANFLKYVEKGHYNGTIFHRVMDNFMVQGGGFTADMTQKPVDAPIKNEWRNGLKNARGTVAMARTAIADSATSQFFINVVNNDFLDQARDGAAYAVFGQVIKGMDTVDQIKAVPVGTKNGMQNVPNEPVVIQTVERVSAADFSDAIQAARTAEQERAKAEMESKGKALAQGIDLVKSKGVDVASGTTSPSGLWSVDSKVGDGAQPAATSQVKVHYTGWLTDGKEFDSSVKRGQPATFPLNGVIKGWTEGVSGMKVGGKRFLVIPHELAYGAAGRPPVIPPASTLVFEIELLEIVSP